VRRFFSSLVVCVCEIGFLPRGGRRASGICSSRVYLDERTRGALHCLHREGGREGAREDRQLERAEYALHGWMEDGWTMHAPSSSSSPSHHDAARSIAFPSIRPVLAPELQQRPRPRAQARTRHERYGLDGYRRCLCGPASSSAGRGRQMTTAEARTARAMRWRPRIAGVFWAP